jgi:predicted ATP-grasp superfamily ATP-dependent carboligase
MSFSQPTPVLLAATDHHGVLAAVRGLHVAGYAPWLAVHKAGTYAARSRATAGTVPVPDPSFDGEGFVRELAAAAGRLSAAALLPTGEPQLLSLADREADFPAIAFGVPSRESVKQATDKESLLELGANAGLRAPPTVKVVKGDTEAMSAFGFPAILKPLRSQVRNPDGTVSAYLARYVAAQQAGEAIEDLPDEGGLVQPFIPGELVSVSGVSWKGELVCALHQLAIRIWPVPVGGSSYAVTIRPDAGLEQGVGRLLRAIGWSGLFQAQFIRNSGGEHYLIDFNPRVYGTLALSLGAGLNLPAIWVKLLLGERPRFGGYRIGARFRNEEKDVQALAQLLVDGERLRALRGGLPRRGTANAVFSPRDPMPLLTSVGKLAGRLRSR